MNKYFTTFGFRNGRRLCRPDFIWLLPRRPVGPVFILCFFVTMMMTFQERVPAQTALAIGKADERRSDAVPDNEALNSIGLRLIRIPAGEFLMGSNESAEHLKAAFSADKHAPEFFSDEYPQHRVRITRPFYLGKTEVTIGQFRQFVEATNYKTQAETDGEGGWGFNEKTRICEGRKPHFNWRDTGFTQSEFHPVMNVTWNDANAFCEWLSKKEGVKYRLPTEAEWEYACRAGSTNRYSAFDDPDKLIEVSRTLDGRGKTEFPHVQEVPIPEDGSIPFTAPVGSFPANAFGLHDMHGNAWEWTSDWHGDDYYSKSPVDDPRGPETGTTRVRRGGAWNSFPLWARASFRNWNSPGTRCVNLGFRVVAESSPPRDTVSVVICGDVMLDGGPGHEVVNGVDVFKDFAPLFQNADISICNLECVIASGGEVLQKAYTFRGADGSLPLLKKHFSAVSIANNHSADFGTETFVRQLEMMETGGLAYFGGGRNLDEARKPLIIQRNGQRIAFLGYNGFNPIQYSATSDKAGVGPLDVDLMVADIRRARSEYKADIVIPYVHWGRELVPSPRPIHTEISHRLIDAGASIVVGAHPHITQTVDIYKGRPIVYSLGNFVFDYFPVDPPVWVGWVTKFTFHRDGRVDMDTTALEIDKVGIPHPIVDE